jgi:spermidine/putrescine transport system permease protein
VPKKASALDQMPVGRFARQTRWGLIALTGAVLAFLYLPIAFLVLFSFEVADTPGLPITGLTLKWYERLLHDSLIQTAVLTSVEVAVVVTIIATIVGTMVAFPLVRGGIRWPGTLRLGFTMPIMIPGVLIGIGLLIFFRQVLKLQLGLNTVVAGHLVFTIPFVVLIVAARLQGFDRRLEWAAADLGANSFRTMRHIVLPLIAPAILAGSLLCVTLSIDEFVITFFTIGPQQTLPLFIYTQIKFGVTPEVNAVATLILAITLGVMIGGSLLMGGIRRFRRARARIG